MTSNTTLYDYMAEQRVLAMATFGFGASSDMH